MPPYANGWAGTALAKADKFALQLVIDGNKSLYQLIDNSFHLVIFYLMQLQNYHMTVIISDDMKYYGILCTFYLDILLQVIYITLIYFYYSIYIICSS